MKFRLKAFLCHLAISLVIASLSALVVFVIWHPSPLAKAVGVSQIFLMMLAIDTILGPLLTLIIAKQGKKSLKFDLIVIAIIQLAALGYGLYNIAQNRPVYMAFDNVRFDLVSAISVPKDSLENASPSYQKLPWGSPLYVAVIPPKNFKEQDSRVFTELQLGITPSMQPNLYEPLDNQWQQIVQKSSPLSDLNNYNNPQQVADIIQQNPQANAYLPLKASKVDMSILIDNENRKIIKIVDLRPW